MTPITIAYFTCRIDPKIQWFYDSLNRELKNYWGFNWKHINILIIDYYYQYTPQERELEFACEYTDKIKVISPKPTPWQGLHKLTEKEYFAASNARNTAFAACTTDYIVCIDDLSVLVPGWLDVVKWGVKNKYVVLGAYAKVNNLEVNPDGSFVFDQLSFEKGLDSRYNNSYLQNIMDPVRVSGSWLYGCSFGLPIEYALTVDGFDEACDGQGAEDYDFGIRLGRITHDIYYCKKMMTYESEELHHIPGNAHFLRQAKVLTQDTLMKRAIGVNSDHAMLENVMHSDHLPFLKTDLGSLRETYQETHVFPSNPITTDWRTGELLNTL